jgi:hypothetical protein
MGCWEKTCIEELLRALLLGCLSEQSKRRSAAVMGLFAESVGQYKSTWYETARNLFRSRNTQRARAERLAEQNRELKLQNGRLAEQWQRSEALREQTQQRLHQQQQENQELRQRPLKLPSDLPLPHHTYGPKMIALCLNLCQEVGFRPAPKALSIIFDWLGIEANIPSFDALRVWACRAGVAQLQLPLEGEDWLWLADHSNQIGQEKVLQIIGIRVRDLPPLGETLPLGKMQVLATVSGTSWTRDDVRREYKKLAERMGRPQYLLTDGAVELRESVDVLEIAGEKPILLRDMKHYAANVLEQLIGKDERFQAYLSKLGRTRSAVQQTELSHFTPPPQKPKARFMNLGPTLRWGQMVSYHLSHSRSKSREGIAAGRMNAKLGWVRGFRDELAIWNRCQEVMQASLSFVNRQGVYRGAAAKLQAELDRVRADHPPDCEVSATMAAKLIAFVKDSESQLGEGDRAWLSTENLESLFGRYKRLEGQHSKGGFTSLLAALPMLLTTWTPARVREGLTKVSVKEMKQWVQATLGTTLASRRVTAYQESALTSYG